MGVPRTDHKSAALIEGHRAPVRAARARRLRGGRRARARVQRVRLKVGATKEERSRFVSRNVFSLCCSRSDSFSFFFYPDEYDIVYAPNGAIRAASMLRLVDFVVLHNSDPDLIRTLIITNRLFEKPGWLMSNLTFTCASYIFSRLLRFLPMAYHA